MLRMDLHQRLSEIETGAKAAGIPVPVLLRGVGIHITLWNRWKRGAGKPSWRNLERLQKAQDTLLEERAA